MNKGLRLSRCMSVLCKAEYSEKSDEMQNIVLTSNSYEEAMGIVREYIELK